MKAQRGIVEPCGKKFLLDDSKVCTRPNGHSGLHFDAKSIKKSSIQWGDNEVGFSLER